MPTSQYQAYDTLKQHIGEQGATLMMEYIHSKIGQEMEYNNKLMATKEDMMLAKQDLRSEIMAVRSELKEDIMAVRSELKADIIQLRTELKAEIMAVRVELLEKIMALKAELTKTIYIVGLLQFLAIVGSVIAIFKFMIK